MTFKNVFFLKKILFDKEYIYQNITYLLILWYNIVGKLNADVIINIIKDPFPFQEEEDKLFKFWKKN